MTDGVADGPTAATDPLSAEGLTTYLRCPRQYEFAHVHGLEADGDDAASVDRVDLLRTAICDALRDAAADRERLVDAAKSRLESLWNNHDERFHSVAQRRHERRVLEATLEAYVDRVGVDHASGIERLATDANGEALIGPDVPLSSTISLPDGTPDVAGTDDADGTDGTDDADESTEPTSTPNAVSIEATVDYVYADEGSVVGVRFVPTLAPLGLLRYRSGWEKGVADRFTDHFDPDADVYEPTLVGALFETSVVVDGLRNRCERLGLEDRTCRYVQIPLADRSRTSVNWVRETVETSLETIDLTEVYIDHHTYGMTHEHRNRTVDDRLAAVAAKLAGGAFDPSDRWDDISTNACSDCGYTVCCQDYVGREVRFDG